MHLECHAALGWVIANIATSGAQAGHSRSASADRDRRLRNYIVIAAILPDIDALPYLFGAYYYGLYHHTFGHNIFLWFALAAWGVKRFGSWKAGMFAFISFGSHLLTDAFLSNWFLYLFWPFSRKGFLPGNSLELGSPVNTWLLYSTPVWLPMVALIWKRTPLEWISPKLDHLFVSFFRRKDSECYVCARVANIECETCCRPICPRHLQVKRKWNISCPGCRSQLSPVRPESSAVR